MMSVDICTSIELPEQQSNNLLGFEADDVYDLYMISLQILNCRFISVACILINSMNISVGVNT